MSTTLADLNLYLRNLESLRTRDPDLIKELQTPLENQESFRITTDKTGTHLLVNNHTIDSLPFTTPLETEKFSVGTMIVVGFGLGGFLIEVIKRLHPRCEELIVVEPSQTTFQLALQYSDYSVLLKDPKIHWWIGLSEQNLMLKTKKHFLELARAIRYRSHALVMHPSLAKASPEYEIAKNAIHVGLQSMELDFGDAEDAWIGMQQTFANLRAADRISPLRALTDSLKNVPALVISAGPSLIESLPLIREARERALILATDASLRILLKEGILPDLVCCLERDLETLQLFEGLKGPLPPLLTFFTSHPELKSRYEGPVHFVFRDYAYHRILAKEFPDALSLSAGHSVSHLTARLGAWLGCDPICLVAQDLSYDENTLASHAKGFALPGYDQPQTLASLKEPIHWLKGKDGKLVPSQMYWHLFLNEFALMSAETKSLRNATPKGAHIPFIPSINLEEAIKTWSIFDKNKWKQEWEAALLSSTPKKWDAESWRIQFQDLYLRFQQLQDRLQKPGTSLYEIRAAQLELIQDQNYLSFVAEPLGSLFLKLENRLYQAFQFEREEMQQRALIEEWFRVHSRQVQRLQQLA